MTTTTTSLQQHILAMADDAYLQSHPEWAEIVREAKDAYAQDQERIERLTTALREVVAARVEHLNPMAYYEAMDEVADMCHKALAQVSP